MKPYAPPTKRPAIHVNTRALVLMASKGRCWKCQFDILAMWLDIRSYAKRAFAQGFTLKEVHIYARTMYGPRFSPRKCWDLHHVIAVSEGHDPENPDNWRIACLVCHKPETAKLAKRKKLRKYRGALPTYIPDELKATE
ncbi:MAG: HNH endonuclease [Candidatus Sulfotelmatobacter sp.]